VKKFAESAKPSTTEAAKEEDQKAVDDSVPLPEDGLTPNHIDMVIEHTKCSRNKAILALRETNDDMVQAVMKLTQ